MYRPRGSLARALYDKTIADEKLKQLDKNEYYMQESETILRRSRRMVVLTIGCTEVMLHCWLPVMALPQWYQVTICQLNSELRGTFIQLTNDEETDLFLEQSVAKSSWVFTQVWHCLLKTFLNIFMTQTSINGFLRRGSMFVFSRNQFHFLTSWEQIRPTWDTSKPKLLDLGAGDGATTSLISSLFDEVFVTEVSSTMKWILAEKGFRILQIENWERQTTKFEVITCLNLLDRCDRPLDILSKMKKVLQPNGIVVLAIVLPYKPFVEVGSKNHLPSQTLNITGCTFEEQTAAFANNVLKPSGYKIIKWSKLPYLCEGDLRQSYYWLDDVVFVLKPEQEIS